MWSNCCLLLLSLTPQSSGKIEHLAIEIASNSGTIKITCYIFATLIGALTIGTFVSGMVGE